MEAIIVATFGRHDLPPSSSSCIFWTKDVSEFVLVPQAFPRHWAEERSVALHGTEVLPLPNS